MGTIKVIEDERGVTAYINPASVSMWRPHWTGPGIGKVGHDETRTDLYFLGEDDGFTIRMTPEQFAAAWESAMADGGEW